MIKTEYTDPAPYWRYYWIATLPDGRRIAQFDATGRKLPWPDLPAMPVQVDLMPFSKEMAEQVRVTSKIAAIHQEGLPPVSLSDMGEGLIAGIDEQLFTQPTVECLTCGHEFPFDPSSKAECPACHARDEWFCADCQAVKIPLAIHGQVLCPTCKAQNKTRGLKRIMKFRVQTKAARYNFEHWIRSPPVEVRAIRGTVQVGLIPPSATALPSSIPLPKSEH